MATLDRHSRNEMNELADYGELNDDWSIWMP